VGADPAGSKGLHRLMVASENLRADCLVTGTLRQRVKLHKSNL